MTDDEYNRQFGGHQEPEFSGFRIAMYMLGLLVLTFFLLWASAAFSTIAAEEACPHGNQEARITEAVTDKDTLWVFEGAGLNTFMHALNENGLMAGTPTNTDKILVARDAYNRYTVFFLFHRCIVFAAHAPTSVMERILPK
jgi:hypothetical protein